VFTVSSQPAGTGRYTGTPKARRYRERWTGLRHPNNRGEIARVVEIILRKNAWRYRAGAAQ